MVAFESGEERRRAVIHRLKGSDAGFLYAESSTRPSTQPSTPVYFAELKPAIGPGGVPLPVTMPLLRERIERRLDFLPSLRWRLVRVPLGLHHAVWIDDPDFDLDYHVRHVTLEGHAGPDRVAEGHAGPDRVTEGRAGPDQVTEGRAGPDQVAEGHAGPDRVTEGRAGPDQVTEGRAGPDQVTEGRAGPDQVDRLIAAIAERCLDRRHPLWQVTLVDGLEDGRQFLLFCFHHAMADGAAAIATLFLLLNDAADAADAADATISTTPWRPERPRGARLLFDALRDQGRASLRIPGLVRSTRRRFAAVAARRQEATVAVPRPARDTPVCVINNSFSAKRLHARTVVAIAGVRRVKEVAGVTLNDVVLAMAATALRRYLADRGELPELPLTATVPVSLDPPGASARLCGNSVISFLTSLATDADDPWERLLTISKVAHEAKLQLDLRGPDTMARWLEHAPPAIAEPAMRKVARSLRKRRDRPGFNVVVSNLRGPSVPWSFGSTAVEHLWVSGPLLDGSGVNVTVLSYRDQLSIAVRTNPDAIDSPAELAAGIADALAELLDIAESRDRRTTEP